MIIPVLAELHLHLEQLKNSPGFVDTVRLMQLKLEERFDYITNPRATNFDPLFTICTFLNPEYKDILNKDQELVATTRLITWMTSYPEVVVLQQPSQSMVQSNTDDDYDSEPSPKNSNVKKLIIEKRRAAKEGVFAARSRSKEIHRDEHFYSNSLDDDRDLFIFWQQNEYAYPLPSKAAFDLLNASKYSSRANFLYWRRGNHWKKEPAYKL